MTQFKDRSFTPVSCPSLQKSDHGQVLLDAVFKHLELTERDYFGLHLADDTSDTPVSIFPINVSVCSLSVSKHHSNTNSSDSELDT